MRASSFFHNAIYFLLGPEKIVCTFEEDTCLFEDELTVKERWITTKSTVRKWDNTLNVGMYLVVRC